MDDVSFSSAEFSGTARLFPLPDLVLFPHVTQPLRVFEPRYVAMLEEALAGDRLIAMVTLVPGWEGDYEGRPPVEPVGCLGRVLVHHQLDDGAYNILLYGLRRLRLLRELPPTKPFREAVAEIQEDHFPMQELARGVGLMRKLREFLTSILPSQPQAREHLDQLLGSDLPLGTLTDVIGYMLDIDVQAKQALLAEVDVYRRAEALLKHLAAARADDRPGRGGLLDFPPAFSAN